MLEVVLVNRQRRRRIDSTRLRRVLQGAATALRVSGEVALVFAGDRTLRRLNREYRGKDKATDVLSFPGQPRDRPRRHRDQRRDRGTKRAGASGAPCTQELDVLALHGFLHVLGYDHETDEGQMDRLERRLRRRLLGRSLSGDGRAADRALRLPDRWPP